MKVRVTRDDLEQQPAFATVYTVTGVREDTGQRVRFGGDWRVMGEFFEEVMEEGVGLAEIESWQVLDAGPPEYQPDEEPGADFPGEESAA